MYIKTKMLIDFYNV